MDEPTINPYQSPASQSGNRCSLGDVDRPLRPAYALYSVGSVTLATVLGSLLAGGVVMAINYRRSGKRAAAIHAVLWSAVATVGIFVAGMIVPDWAHIPNAAFLVPQILGMYGLAKELQGPAVEAHRRGGGRLASAWGAAGIGLLTGVVMGSLLFGVLILMANIPSE